MKPIYKILLTLIFFSCNNKSSEIDNSIASSTSIEESYFKDSIDVSEFVDEPTFFTQCYKSIYSKTYQWNSNHINLYSDKVNEFVNTFNKIKLSLKGIYLVDFSDDGPGRKTQGMACRTANNNFHVFLSKDYVSQRFDFTNLDTDSYDYEVAGFFQADYSAADFFTLIHELFHVVDYNYFMKSTEGTREYKLRDAYLSASFDSENNDIFQQYFSGKTYDEFYKIYRSVAMVSQKTGSTSLNLLANENNDIPLIWSCGKSRHHKKNNKLSLVNSSPYTYKDIGDYYKKIAHYTNFVSLYASYDYLEDFAESMTTYYLGTKFGISKKEIVKDPISGEVYHTHTPFDVMKQSTLVQSKVCPMIAYFFNGSCDFSSQSNITPAISDQQSASDVTDSKCDMYGVGSGSILSTNNLRSHVCMETADSCNLLETQSQIYFKTKSECENSLCKVYTLHYDTSDGDNCYERFVPCNDKGVGDFDTSAECLEAP